MTITMNTTNLTIEEMEVFIKSTTKLEIKVGSTIDATYAWIECILTTSRYLLVRRKDKSIVRKYLICCTGYSVSHVDHCIAEYRQTGRIKRKVRTCVSEFATFYTSLDIALLGEYAKAYNHQNGRAICAGLRDMYHIYGDVRFERLAKLSVSHFYNLRQTQIFKNVAPLLYTKTTPTKVNIGERRKPFPHGKPGYIRVDSVHQGDKDKEKGVYHIHLVDEITQWDITVTVEGISEYFLIPALSSAITEFPFKIHNFHSDNGSEYINGSVAKMLNTLTITQTKSRSRRTNDQALVEGKNASTIRTVYGKVHIPKRYAEVINEFNYEHLHHFINYHRKCLFSIDVQKANGKIVKKYVDCMTPCEKLLSMSNIAECLRAGVTVATLKAKALETNHFTAAQDFQKARTRLFKTLSK